MDSKLILRKIKEDGIDCFLVEGCVLAGGSIRDYILGETPKDYDLFFISNEAVNRARDILLTKKAQVQTRTLYTETWESVDGKIIQLIFKKIYSSPEEIINSFDFNSVCAFVNKEEVYIKEGMLRDLTTKSVSINVITKPINSLQRLSKYLRKGYDVKESYDYIVSLLMQHGHEIILNGQFYN